MAGTCINRKIPTVYVVRMMYTKKEEFVRFSYSGEYERTARENYNGRTCATLYMMKFVGCVGLSRFDSTEDLPS